METLVDELVDFIARRSSVSIVEIESFLSQRHVPTKGSLWWVLGVDPNIVIWANMSQEWMDIMNSVQADGRIEMGSAHYLAYLCDGGALNLPLAKRLPKGGYKTPHWAPVIFNRRKK